jgi:ribosomal protein S18 acetylase RimI-like enzyme
MADPVLTLSDAPDQALRDLCREIFMLDAAAKGVPHDFLPLTIRVEQDGALLGGLVGRTLRGWLLVDNLAIHSSAQSQGLGSRLLRMAEEEAARRGCMGSFLNTDGFQAPAFYRRHGYSEFGRLEQDDPRLTRIWFAKRFAR